MGAVDLTQFHKTFFEESLEGLDAMEAALLALDSGSTDHELVHTIFRAAHSITGGAANPAYVPRKGLGTSGCWTVNPLTCVS